MRGVKGELINFLLPLNENLTFKFESELLLVPNYSLLEPFVSLFAPRFKESSLSITLDYISGVVSKSILSLPVVFVVLP